MKLVLKKWILNLSGVFCATLVVCPFAFSDDKQKTEAAMFEAFGSKGSFSALSHTDVKEFRIPSKETQNVEVRAFNFKFSDLLWKMSERESQKDASEFIMNKLNVFENTRSEVEHTFKEHKDREDAFGEDKKGDHKFFSKEIFKNFKEDYFSDFKEYEKVAFIERLDKNNDKIERIARSIEKTESKSDNKADNKAASSETKSENKTASSETKSEDKATSSETKSDSKSESKSETKSETKTAKK